MTNTDNNGDKEASSTETSTPGAEATTPGTDKTSPQKASSPSGTNAPSAAKEAGSVPGAGSTPKSGSAKDSPKDSPKDTPKSGSTMSGSTTSGSTTSGSTTSSSTGTGSAKPAAAKSAPPPKKGRGGFLGGFIGGLLAVLLCIGGVTAAVESGQMSWPWDGATAEPTGPTTQELASEVASLRQKLNATSSSLASLRSAVPDDLKGRLSAAESGQAQAGAATGQVSGLKTDFESFQQKTTAELAQLQDRVSSFQSRLPSTDVASRLDSQASQLSTLSASLNALEKQVNALNPEVSDLTGRVAAIEQKEEDPSALERAAFALAVANLARASETSQPFASELDTLATFVSGDPAVAKLEPAAQSGVPTEQTLVERFPAVAESVMKAHRTAEAETGIWGEIVAGANAVVSVRRTDDVDGDGPAAVLARMEQNLSAGDLPGAVSEADKLQGPAADAASDWVSAAKERVETNRLVDELTSRVTKDLAQATKGQQ